MPSPPSRAGDRSVTDGTTPMGIGTTRELERVCAAMGMLDAAPLRFESADDLPNGGTLCALPALLAFGLLDHQEDAGLSLPKGFYSLPCIFLLIALLALARIPSVEQLRYESPGEWGRLLGLDRIPEVRTLREKIARLAQTPESVARWAASLATSWMERHEAHIIGTLLVDGHTRVYHGSIANLPKRYISRERLCLRATTDYWVNALDGAPLFCVTKPVDPGLQKTLENDIIPRLLNELPHQPGTAELAARPLLHRFTVVFDREGYSPALFARLKQKRIAILTYHKHPGENWSPAEFNEREVELLNGEKVTLRLAERGTWLESGKLWLREIRRLDDRGHQTAILSTDYQRALDRSAAAMFARWHQENFFKYMREHYGLDRLVEHGTSPLPDPTRLVNPAWRALESQVRSRTARLTRTRALFAQHSIQTHEQSHQQIARYEQRKGELLAAVQELEQEIVDLKVQRKSKPKHITLADLPEADRVRQLAPGRKQLTDTIKLIAYRAESALVATVRERLKRHDDARSLVRGLMHTTVNLRPDPIAKRLTIELHGQSNPAHDKVIEHLCAELNQTETLYPGTALTLFYHPLRSSNFLPDQDV